MMNLLAALFVAFLAIGPASAAFENVGAGARPLGMAGAFTAVSDDAHAIHYNPAGLAQVRRSELTAGYGKLYLGLKDHSNLGTGFVGAVQPLQQGRLGSLGIGWLSLSLEGAYREDLISLAYGKEVLREGLFLGGAAKLMKRSFGTDAYTQIDPLFTKNGQNTTNTSFDLGVMYRPSAVYSFGLAIKDANQPDVALSGTDRVPLELRGGFGYHQRQLLFDADFSRKDKDFNVSMGLEKLLLKTFGLRAGFTVGSRSRRELATGMSYKGEHFSLDYAFLFPLAGVESTAGSHRFGVTVRFGQAPEKALWEFEDESNVFERLLEEKSAQIGAMEKELENLREQGRGGKLESKWVRDQIKKLEEQLKTQESKDLETLKSKLFESKVETERMKRKMLDLEDRLRRLSERRVPEPVAAPSEPAAPKTYMVKEGETLQTIAERFYGDPSKWVEIYELNSDRIERGGTIRTGQVLLLPHK